MFAQWRFVNQWSMIGHFSVHTSMSVTLHDDAIQNLRHTNPMWTLLVLNNVVQKKINTMLMLRSLPFSMY